MKELARLFENQCIGSYSGHMASIPNNPVIWSIFMAADACGDRKKFVSVLRAFADELEKLTKDDLPF
jgi:hypothetical protein